MRSEAERAEGEAFADYCRNAKPPITADDPARCATAVASFSAGWKAGYACDDMPDDLKQIQDLLAHAFIGKATTVVGKGLVERWESTIATQAEAIRLLRAAWAWYLDDDGDLNTMICNGRWHVMRRGKTLGSGADACDAVVAAYLATTAPKEPSE